MGERRVRYDSGVPVGLDGAQQMQRAIRNARCLNLSGCDGYSHDIACNEAYYAAPGSVGDQGRRAEG